MNPAVPSQPVQPAPAQPALSPLIELRGVSKV